MGPGPQAVNGGREGPERHGEHHRVHLATQDLLQRHALLRRPNDAEAVARGAERLEEGQALNVVPVGVGEQDVGRDRAVPPDHELVAEGTQSAPGVEDHQPSVGSGEVAGLDETGLLDQRGERARDAARSRRRDPVAPAVDAPLQRTRRLDPEGLRRQLQVESDLAQARRGRGQRLEVA